MNKMILIAITSLLPLFADAAPQENKLQTPLIQAGAPMPLAPSPNWSLIRAVVGPTIPTPWQLFGVEGVIYQGNSISEWQVYFYNPSTRQTAGWLISIP
jgi:hypothetical protein